MKIWPWHRSSDVDTALVTSERRLEAAKRQRAAMEPEVARLQRNAEANHFYDAVMQGFKVDR